MKKRTKILILLIGVIAVVAGTSSFLFIKRIRSAEYAYDRSREAIERGDSAAMLRWMNVAGSRGHIVAQLELAQCFEYGVFGDAKNDERAAFWYKKAADAGNGIAQFNLGTFRWLGRGGPEDKKEAIALWEKAAENGIPNAADNLGICYRDGLGVEKDPAKAKDYFIKAATKDYENAQFNLGLFYESEKNEERALYWYEKAASQGHDAAKRRFESITGTHL